MVDYKIFDDSEDTIIDKLPPEKREVIERVAIHILVHLAKHLSNYSFYIVRKLEDRGLKVNLSYDMRKFRRAVVVTIMFDLKDMRPDAILQYYRYYFRKTGTDRWAKWTFFKTMKELTEEIMEEAADSYLEEGSEEEKVEAKASSTS